MTRKIPPEVEQACRLLHGNGSMHTLIRWMAEEHGLGDFDPLDDPGQENFRRGQARNIAFLAQLTGCEIVLVRGRDLKARTAKENGEDEKQDGGEPPQSVG